jgi:hopene-associated glycosyltransferase HpnB
MLAALAVLPVLVWLYLLFARGGFWRISILNRAQRAPNALCACERPDRTTRRRVVAVIPARNEAAVIGRALQSLAPQLDHIVVVDDSSADGTAEIARACGRKITVVPGKPLAFGWTGKLWALAQGVTIAEAFAPDYLLFTDADIEHGPGSLAELVGLADERKLDLASYMVQLACITTAEKALIPAFVFFFLKLYPPKWISSARAKTAAAAGGCILIRPQALSKIGGLAAIRNEVIDDCALARAIKGSGGRIWMGLTREASSIRSYGGFAEIGRMISRTAFNQLHHSALLLAGAILALFITYLLPPLLLLTGRPLPIALGAIAWLLMSVAYLPMLRFYNRSPFWSLALPLITVFYLGATVHSAVQYWRGRGGTWKDRVQDVRTS